MNFLKNIDIIKVDYSETINIEFYNKELTNIYLYSPIFRIEFDKKSSRFKLEIFLYLRLNDVLLETAKQKYYSVVSKNNGYIIYPDSGLNIEEIDIQSVFSKKSLIYTYNMGRDIVFSIMGDENKIIEMIYGHSKVLKTRVFYYDNKYFLTTSNIITIFNSEKKLLEFIQHIDSLCFNTFFIKIKTALLNKKLQHKFKQSNVKLIDDILAFILQKTFRIKSIYKLYDKIKNLYIYSKFFQ